MKGLLRFPDLLVIATGGACGSLLRTLVGSGYEGVFPVPTLMINLFGAAALAILYARQHRIHLRGRYLYMVGFCGSFTTVSLFSFEIVQLAKTGHTLAALTYLGSTVAVALLLVFVLVRRLELPTPEKEEAT